MIFFDWHVMNSFSYKCPSPVGCSCQISWMHLRKRVRSPHLNVWPGYDTKLFNGEASVRELWGMWSNCSLPLIPGPLKPWVVKFVWDPSIRRLELVSWIWSFGECGVPTRCHYSQVHSSSARVPSMVLLKLLLCIW